MGESEPRTQIDGTSTPRSPENFGNPKGNPWKPSHGEARPGLWGAAMGVSLGPEIPEIDILIQSYSYKLNSSVQ